jgi:hypothetical protein
MIEIGKEMVCIKTDRDNILQVDKIYSCTGIFDLCGCGTRVSIGRTYKETPRLGFHCHCEGCGRVMAYPTDEHLFPIKLFVSMDDFLNEEISELVEETELVSNC